MSNERPIGEWILDWPPNWRTVVGAIVTAIIAFAGWYIKKKIEMIAEKPKDLQKQSDEALQDKRSKAAEACREIQEISAEWENSVREAVNTGGWGPGAERKLLESIQTNKFNWRLAQQLPFVSSSVVPECGDVAIFALKFALTALQRKSTLVRILSPGNVLPKETEAYIDREVQIFLDHVQQEGGELLEQVYRAQVKGWMRELMDRPEADEPPAIIETLQAALIPHGIEGDAHLMEGKFELYEHYKVYKTEVLNSCLSG